MRDDKPLTEFDADVSPQSEVNRAAAKERGLRFDESKNCYVDEDGCLIRDKFGQPY